MRHFLLSVYFTCLALPLLAQQHLDALTQKLQEISDRKTLPGFAVSMVTADGVRYAQGFGFADVAAQKPFTPETILNVGSVSKTFIGVAVAKALEEGVLTLDTPINDFLPFTVENPHFRGLPITLRHLVTHTSGIVDREAVYDQAYSNVLDAGDYKAFLKDYLDKNGQTYSRKNFMPHKPGAWQQYSNLGSALAAYVLELATKTPFNDYTRKHIFTPLRLASTGWFFKDINQRQHATLYNTQQKAIPLYSLITYPDGGLKSTLLDLSLYLQEIIKGASENGSLLSNSMYTQLLGPQFNSGAKPQNLNPKEPNIGLFWMHRLNGEVGHTGSDPGITTFMFFHPGTKTGRIFLTNISLETPAQMQAFSEVWKLLKEYENGSTPAKKSE